MATLVRLLLWLNLVVPVLGCSDFLLSSSSGVISGRSMDFEADLDSVFEVIPRGTTFQELPVSGCPDCPDFEWRNKFGFVAANVYGVNVATDGLNEAGLSAAWLYLVATKYPDPKHFPDLFNKSKPIVTSLCSFILGNFASVDEVKRGLQNVQVAGIDGQVVHQILNVAVPDVGGPVKTLPLHVSVHDADGNNLVIEIIDGELKFHDNPNGVLTNDPPFEEQLKLLSKHQSEATGNINTGDLVPGGYGPTERFIRLSVLNDKVKEGYSAPTVHVSYVEATDEQREVSNALHLLNTVVRPPMGEATQWSLVRDHKRRMLYIRSTANQLLRRVSLDMVDWADPHARRLIPVSYGVWFMDTTVPLLDDHNTMRTKDLLSRSEIKALLSKPGDMSAVFAGADKVGQGELPTISAMEMEQASQISSLSPTWVFVVGTVAGGMLTALFSAGWKLIITECVRRQHGYRPIAGADI